MYQHRVQDLNQRQRKQYSEIKGMLRSGRIPAALLSPAIIKQHNESQPDIAHIKHGDQAVSLDALAVLYCAEGHIARQTFRDQVIRQTPPEPEEEDLLEEPKGRRHISVSDVI